MVKTSLPEWDYRGRRGFGGCLLSTRKSRTDNGNICCAKDTIIETPMVSYFYRAQMSYPNEISYNSWSPQCSYANPASQINVACLSDGLLQQAPSDSGK